MRAFEVVCHWMEAAQLQFTLVLQTEAKAGHHQLQDC